MAALRALLLVLATVVAVRAQPAPTPSPPTIPPPPTSQEARRAELQAAWQAADAAATRGPASVPLRDQASLAVPADMAFIPAEQANRLLRALGNTTASGLVGLVASTKDNAPWLVVVRWVADGYVRDDDAKDLNPDDILKSLREGTEQGNEDRRARGFPALEILGWAEPPQYDATTHRLVWAMKVKEVGDADDEAGVNLNTRALGREGYFSLNLLTGLARLEQDRPVPSTLLAGLQFNEGKRYSDFNASTDHVAEYGLAALIGVVAAKKLGLLALAGVFVVKFAKVGLIALAGAGLAIKRFFRRKPAA